ncbi:hypothetical protein AAW01_00180 [Aurantiacibacter gangjinensis]|uniref:Lipoprotein n=1 Tax=Aurantiacibacter gangjinensis TaxID=502682 RepID=A0A0G9MPH3_9SPHN|nr:hypothetical protein AAW01_00180 [Aurantiacibacter gangjinensis]
MKATLFVSLAALAVAACGDTQESETMTETAQPAPVLTPAPIPTVAADGTALVPGAWTVNENASGGFATYGVEGEDPSLTFDCETATGTVTMTLSRQASAMEAWRLDAGGEAARIDMMPVDGPFPLVAASIEPSLAIFHAFSEPGQTVTLTSPEGAPMQFPTHPGISRIMQACS